MGGVYCLATDKIAGAAGRNVWSGSNDFTCNMWNDKGEFLKLYAGHTGGVRSILGACTDCLFGGLSEAFVEDLFTYLPTALGSQLWTGSDDHTIRVWDMQFGQCLAVLEGHSSSVLSLVASSTEPDKKLYSGAASATGMVRLPVLVPVAVAWCLCLCLLLLLLL